MIQIKKKTILLNCTIYVRSPNFLKQLNVKNFTATKISWKNNLSRLVFVRAPKHFNKGKIQIFFSNSLFRIEFYMNHIVWMSKINSLEVLVFLKKTFSALPLQHVGHYKVTLKQTVKFIMATKNQKYRLLNRFIYKKLKKPKLKFSPQRKTTVLRLRICSPRKPNSARRPTIKGFMSSKKKVLAYIPGAGHSLKRHSKILIRGGGARDVPVVNYTCIRGVYDFEPLRTKKRRSIYGLGRPVEIITHVRRRFRNLAD